MRAAASTRAVRSERCGETASSKRSRPRRRAVRKIPASPRSRPRLSSISTSSTSGWPSSNGAASGRTRTESRRGASRACSAERSGVVRTTSPRKLVCATSSVGPSRPCDGRLDAPGKGSLEPLGFIDENDRDVVLDPIAQLARPTHERVLRLGQDHLALALRTGEDLQQLLADGHGPSSSFARRLASIAGQVQLSLVPFRPAVAGLSRGPTATAAQPPCSTWWHADVAG